MVKFVIGGFFGFMIGLGYGIYAVVAPEHNMLTGIIRIIAQIKGLF